MEIVRSFDEFHIEGATAVTVGKFDGLHLGHKSIERRLIASGLKSVVVTFSSSPADVLSGQQGHFGIITPNERYMVMQDDGIDAVVELPFDDAIMHMPAEIFVRNLCERLGMRLFVCGADFRFGYKGAGDIALLRELAEKYAFRLCVVEKVQNDDCDISSTRIRHELQEGAIEKVNELLGYDFFVYGRILHGRGLGHRLGFATLNQVPEEGKLLPPYGVYLTRVTLDGKAYTGVTNVGTKPTVSADESVDIETHVLDFDGDLYDTFVKVEFLGYIRKERKFDGVAELSRQIKADEECARKMAADHMPRA